MTVNEMIERLQEVAGDGFGECEVRLAFQPSWPLQFEIGGIDSVTWDAAGADEPGLGDNYVFRQASCLGGGSTEMQRNIISERVLGMPREHTADKDLPFSEVRRNTAPRQPRG